MLLSFSLILTYFERKTVLCDTIWCYKILYSVKTQLARKESFRSKTFACTCNYFLSSGLCVFLPIYMNIAYAIMFYKWNR